MNLSEPRVGVAVAHFSARMRGRQSLEKTRVSVGRVARGAGLEPLVEIGYAVDDATPQLAIDWPVAGETQFRECAFRQPHQARGFDSGHDLCGARHGVPILEITGYYRQFQQCKDICI